MPNRTVSALVVVFSLVVSALVSCRGTTDPPLPDEPTVTINSPEHGATFTQGSEILFEGSATRAGTALATSTLAWTSDKDGELGIGTSFTRSDLSVNTHVITLKAAPADGPAGWLSITIHIEPVSCEAGNFAWPIPGVSRAGISNDYAHYAEYNWVVDEKYHTGIDIYARLETSVVAIADGCVVRIQRNHEGCEGGPRLGCEDRGLGHTVIVRHDLPSGVVYSRYSHLHSIQEEILKRCGAGEGTRVTCEVPVRVTGGETELGGVGCTRFGRSDCSDAFREHLHFETREGSLGDRLGTEGDDGDEFGYSRNMPDEYGFVDPLVIIHQAERFDADRTVWVTAAGSDKPMFGGPLQEYYCFKEYAASELVSCRSLQENQQFLAVARVDGADLSPGCSSGWYQIVNTDRESKDYFQFFPHPDAANSSNPYAWVCAGNDGEVWVTEELALSGRVIDQFTSTPIPGVTVTTTAGSATTDASGRFTVAVASPDDELVFAGSNIHTRRTFAQGSDLDWRVIPADFDMDLFDEVARRLGDLIDVAQNDRTHKWTGGSPEVFIDTRNYGYAPGVLPQEVRSHVAEYIDRWSAGTVSPAQVTVTDSPPTDGTVGTIVIRFVDLSDLKTEEDGETIWALGLTHPYAYWDRYEIVSGVIELDLVSSGLNMDTGLVVGRELGHIFGMGQFHRNRPMMMREITPPPGTPFSAFEAAVVDIVYSRLPGTRSPDTEEKVAAAPAPPAAPLPVGPPIPAWVRAR